MTQETFRDLLLAGLDRSAELRARTVEDATFSERRAELRAWLVLDQIGQTRTVANLKRRLERLGYRVILELLEPNDQPT